MHKSTIQIFQTLEGKWKISRDLDNRGKATGVATFTKLDNPCHLSYTETVQLQFVGHPATEGAHQQYTFIYNQNNNTIEQFTSSNELMYELQVKFDIATGKYLCGSDIYFVNYHFINDNCFTTHYVVRGPQKDYTIHTEFEKIDLIGDC